MAKVSRISKPPKGRVTQWDFQPVQDASRLYYRGAKLYHEAEERDLLQP